MKYEPLTSNDASMTITISTIAVCITVIFVAGFGGCVANNYEETQMRMQLIDKGITPEKAACVEALADGEAGDFCKEMLRGQR